MMSHNNKSTFKLDIDNIPTDNPEIFAPGFVNTHHHEHSAPTISPIGDEIYWSRWRRPDGSLPQVIMYIRKISENEWTLPEIAPFSGMVSDGGPTFNFSGDKLFFYSKRDLIEKQVQTNNIWYVKRENSSWSNPIKITSNVNTDKLQAGPSLAKNNNLYFINYRDNTPGKMALARAEFINGTYSKPEYLGPPFNVDTHDWLPYVALDESYLIFSGNSKENPNRFDLYISFRNPSGSWGKRINLGEKN